MSTICSDAGFLIGVYDERDERHEEAVTDFVRLFGSGANRLLIPWPILYETVSTRMARNIKGLGRMERDWKRLQALSQIQLIPDHAFREGVLEECFEELNRPRRQYRSLSATDRVVRRMLSDVNLRIQAFVTYNPRDFADVCHRFGRQIYPRAQ